MSRSRNQRDGRTKGAAGNYPGLGTRMERDELLRRLSMPATKEEAVRLIKLQSNALRAAVFHYTSALNRIAGASESQALHEEAEAIPRRWRSRSACPRSDASRPAAANIWRR